MSPSSRKGRAKVSDSDYEPDQPEQPSTPGVDAKALAAFLAQMAKTGGSGAVYEQYTVQEGDTLESIAEDKGTDPTVLYAVNASHLEGHATSRGFPSSESGRLLWPGSVLNVPVAEASTSG
jgi:nucleoid-associated protein YgaU